MKALMLHADPGRLHPYHQTGRVPKSGWSLPCHHEPLPLLHAAYLISDYSIQWDWHCNNEWWWYLAPVPSNLCHVCWWLPRANPGNVHTQQPMSQMSGALWQARFIHSISSVRLWQSQGHIPPVRWWCMHVSLGLLSGRPEASLWAILGETPSHKHFCIHYTWHPPSITARCVQALGGLANWHIWFIGNQHVMSIHSPQSPHFDVCQRYILDESCNRQGAQKHVPHSAQSYSWSSNHGQVSPRIITAACALLDFLYLAQLPSHSSFTLVCMEESLDHFHNNKDIFVELGIHNHFKIPKFHSLIHYVPLIWLFDTTDNYNTEQMEQLHICNAPEGVAVRLGQREPCKWKIHFCPTVFSLTR